MSKKPDMPTWLLAMYCVLTGAMLLLSVMALVGITLASFKYIFS